MCNPELFICKSLFQCTIPGPRTAHRAPRRQKENGHIIAIRVTLTVFVKTGCLCGFMRLRNITGKSRILRKPKAAKKRYECNINTRIISGG
jgi:hypothetical protein